MDRDIKPHVRRRIVMARSLRAVVLVLASAAVVVWLVGMLRPNLKRSRIRTAQVERGTLEAVINASGTVEPATEQAVTSPIDARVLRIRHQPGATVVAGEPILDLDVGGARLDLHALDEKIARAKTRQKELELELAEKMIDLRRRESLRKLDVQQLTYELAQNRQLHDEGLTSQATLRQSETRLEKARIEAVSIDESTTNAQAAMATRIANVDSELRSLLSERDEARRLLDRATTRAERGGVLTWVVAEEGVTVRAGDVVARIADLSSFRVDATASDLHAGRLHRGLDVRIPFGDRGRPEHSLNGTIAAVYPAVENGKVRFRIDLEESHDPRLQASLRVDVLVVIERLNNVLTVEKGPFVRGSGPQEVFVVDGDVARRRSVQLGLAGHQQYEIVDGLAVGDEVIVSDVARVSHLTEVTLQ